MPQKNELPKLDRIGNNVKNFVVVAFEMAPVPDCSLDHISTSLTGVNVCTIRRASETHLLR